MFEDTAERLTASGVSVAVQGSRPFKETAFGRAFLSLARFVHEDDAVRTGSMLTDFMESPFSGVTLAEAQKFDAAWRADRDLAHDAAALLQFAAGQSEWAALMVEVAQDGDAVHVRPLRARIGRTPSVPNSCRPLPRSAKRAARRSASACRSP